MITMGVGLMYLWGIISLYTTSYYRIMTNNPNFTEVESRYSLSFATPRSSILSFYFRPSLYPLQLESSEKLVLGM